MPSNRCYGLQKFKLFLFQKFILDIMKLNNMTVTATLYHRNSEIAPLGDFFLHFGPFQADFQSLTAL